MEVDNLPVTGAERGGHTRGCKREFLRGRHRLKTYVRVQESSRNAMRVRAWAETLVIQGVLFGVTTVIKHGRHGDTRTVQHGRRDGIVDRKRERVETPRVEACPLREASACGHGDVFTQGRRVQTERESPVKVSLSRLD